MTRADVDKVGRGRVWTGSQAKELGLVDELGGLSKAIELAKRLAGLAPGRGAKARGLAEEEGLLELDLRPEDRRGFLRAAPVGRRRRPDAPDRGRGRGSGRSARSSRIGGVPVLKAL